MILKIKLVNIWKSITLSTIMTMILMFSMMILTKLQWFPLFYGILALGAIYISMIISALLCSKIQTIKVNDGLITINNSKTFSLDSIDQYYQDKNYFFDGIRIKTKQKKNYYFTTINFKNKDSNFDIFKNILINKVVDEQIPIKSNEDSIKDSKFLKYVSTIGLVLLAIVITLTLLTDFKIDTVKIIYVSMIIIGTFIATRK